MDKGLKLYEKDYPEFSFKFMRLFDLLVSHKYTSRIESILMTLILYLQIISGFFSSNISIFKSDGDGIDPYFIILHDIVRIRNLIVGNKYLFTASVYLILIFYIVFTFIFLIRISKMTKESYYGYYESLLNMVFKYFFYVFFIPIIDISMAVTCTETDYAQICINEKVSYTTDYAGNIIYYDGSKFTGIVTLICMFNLIYTIAISLILALFYNDSDIVSSSLFSRKNCNYEVYFVVNVICFSLILNISKSIGPIIFLIYNVFFSIFFGKFFYEKFPYYDNLMIIFSITFHIFYFWTSGFSIIYFFGGYKNISITYCIGSCIIIYMSILLKKVFENKLILDVPYHKITNQYHFLFYVRNLIDKVSNMEESMLAKSQLIGIINIHVTECPLPTCPVKNLSNKYYLSFTNEWSDPKAGICDKVYLLNYLTFVMSYFMQTSSLSPDLAINFSLFYLEKLGNTCFAMFNYKKVSDAKLTIQESFAYFRLSLIISNSLLCLLKPSNEKCKEPAELNASMYFKYEDLSQKFFEEISNDLNLNLEFWKLFRDFKEHTNRLDFNKVFFLTNKIRLSKIQINSIWKKLFNTYNGYNYLFDLYEKYISHVNDDTVILNELDSLKHQLSLMNNNSNLYNILFSKETGIIIIQGEKGREGLIELVNEVTEKMFEFNKDELKGFNVNFLMPKMFERNHKSFMERYTTIGEKKIIDTSYYTYGKTKNNNILSIVIRIKIFPVLSDSLYFCSLITKNTASDLILLDHKFNIQGMSEDLIKKFNLSQHIFSDFDVPLYLICKKFISHYRDKMPRIKKENSAHTNMMTQSNLDFFKLFQKEKDVNYFNKREDKDNVINSLDVEENSETFFDIKIPNLIRAYAPNKTNVGNLLDLRYFENKSEDVIDEIEEDDRDGSLAEEEEADLINGNDDKYKYDKFSNQYTGKDPDKEFQSKLKYYTQIFEKGSYEILEKEIDKLNFENKDNHEFRFCISFKEIKYNTYSGFVMRCINSNEDFIETSSIHSENKIMNYNNDRDILNANTNMLKRNFSNLKFLEEVTKEDKTLIEEKTTEYNKLYNNSQRLNKLVNEYHNDIIIHSRIFGKQENNDDLDILAQNSKITTYSTELSKRTRIEEIKENLMSGVEDFFTLKWIKGIYYLLLIITFLFCLLYVFNFLDLFENSLSANILNLKIYQISFELGNLISTLFSLKAVVDMRIHNDSQFYNSFDDNPKTYFEFMINDAKANYFSLSKNLTVIYYDIKKYIEVDDQILFDKIKMNIDKNVLLNDVPFIYAITQSLNHANNMLNNKLFKLEPYQNISDFKSEKADLDYSYSLSIENMYNYVFPYLLEKLLIIDNKLKIYKSSELMIQMYFLIVYGLFLIIISLIYFLCLFKTNYHMESELKRVSTIRIHHINETIKNLEYFNNRILAKFRENNQDKKVEEKQEEVKQVEETKENETKKSITTTFQGLTILNQFYITKVILLISLIILLILIFFQSQGLISNINNFDHVKNYFFFSFIKSTIDISNIKCTISNCNREKMIDLNTTFTQEEYDIIKTQINFYPQMNDFYTNKYLTNICSVSLFDSDDQLKSCHDNDIIKSANNTENLLNMVTDYIYYLNKEIIIKNKQNPYDSIYYEKIETIFYKFIITMPFNFSKVCVVSLKSFMNNVYYMILILNIVFACCILIFSLYSIFYYIKKLIEYISISRCVLKIIPTSVIINSYELEEWMGNKY